MPEGPSRAPIDAPRPRLLRLATVGRSGEGTPMGMRTRVISVGAVIATAGALVLVAGLPGSAAGRTPGRTPGRTTGRSAARVNSCRLGSAHNRIRHVIYLQFDNTHLSRDNPR